MGSKSRFQAGEIADFNIQLGKSCEPTTSTGWGKDRRLSAAFLREIFYSKADEVPQEGVRIIGAWFPDGLVFPHGRLNRQLLLKQSRFESRSI